MLINWIGKVRMNSFASKSDTLIIDLRTPERIPTDQWFACQNQLAKWAWLALFPYDMNDHALKSTEKHFGNKTKSNILKDVAQRQTKIEHWKK